LPKAVKKEKDQKTGWSKGKTHPQKSEGGASTGDVAEWKRK
jgi:hypothetical protein